MSNPLLFLMGDHKIIGAIVIIQNYQIIDVVQALQSLVFIIGPPDVGSVIIRQNLFLISPDHFR